jgi:hypothetical protein
MSTLIQCYLEDLLKANQAQLGASRPIPNIEKNRTILYLFMHYKEQIKLHQFVNFTKEMMQDNFDRQGIMKEK